MPLADSRLVALGEDPLSRLARAQHRNLVLVSAIAAIIAWLNLVPTRISAIGVDLHSDDRRAIRWVLLLVVAYFLVAFAVTAMADWAAWLERHRDLRAGGREVGVRLAEYKSRGTRLESRVRADASKSAAAYEENQRMLAEERRRHRAFRILAKTEMLRAALDFLLPVGMGLTAIVWLATGLT